MDNLDLQQRVGSYAAGHGLRLIDRLGSGTDGTVWSTDQKSAVKSFEYKKNYVMELACYQRLRQHQVTRIEQLAVPRLIEWNDDLMVIEMSVVAPPYLIDFGKAYLDQEPEHSAEVWADHDEHQRELWEEHYEEVQVVLWKLRQLGIFYQDAKPGNIMFSP